MISLNISELSDIEYNYIFSLDNIRDVIELNQRRIKLIQDLDFLKESKYINKIIRLSNDLDTLAFKLLDRNSIQDNEKFNVTRQAMIICNAKIADCLNKEESKNKTYKKFIRKNKDIEKDIDCFENINIKLGNVSYFEIKLNNWMMIWIIVFIILLLSVILVVEVIIENNIGILFSSILLSGALIILLIKQNELKRAIKFDYIQRVLSRNEYIPANIQEKYDKSFYEGLKSIIQKKL